MIRIGINGFGRIGKCCFLQLINNENFEITCLNATNILVNEIKDYLTYDSTHRVYDKKFDFNVISDSEFKINRHNVKLISERKLSNINWKTYGCEYVIDATGAFLTLNKYLEYNVNYVVFSSPCKDNTKTFVYGVNEHMYSGDKFVSASSCTTNCLTPMLKILNDAYVIKNCIFTTIHSTTASQQTVDIADNSSRITRSIFNNIIPHTTGASSSVINVMPELKGKINGTSVRVPVANCSLLDVNIELEKEDVTLEDIIILIKNNHLYKKVYDISTKNLVSGDFITTITPTILDVNASIDIGKGKFKIMLWYDNEWSYSAQLIRLVENMYQHNISRKQLKKYYHMKNINLKNKSVICRLDLNVPTLNGIITDDYRITCALSTIEYILSQSPSYLVITTHFGRPKGNGYEDKYSLKFLVPILEKYLKKYVKFLEYGISDTTLEQLHRKPLSQFSEYPNKPVGVYLLENLRFYKEEMNYENFSFEDRSENKIINIYKNLGDIFICDAFGCLHREHMSICGIKDFKKTFGYGNLIQKETDVISKIINNKNSKILAIIGGNKIKDKLPIIDSFRMIDNAQIFVTGGLAKYYNENYDNVTIMTDGFGNSELNLDPIKIDNIKNTDYNVYDIGDNSLDTLFNLIRDSDIIFWNGSLGVIEHPIYKEGSVKLIEYLKKFNQKTIIMGGGETASLISDKNSNIYASTGGGALLEYLEKKITKNENLAGLDIYV
jgi:glyceraldehyde 3-phosphate dehydrogenase